VPSACLFNSAFENKRRYNAFYVIPTEVEESFTISLVVSVVTTEIFRDVFPRPLDWT
jgi:hypothetical protein